MNAMTGPDYTVYPFSTPNQRDYYQLLSIYLDAVFRPLLRDLDFCQEGWRLEHEVCYVIFNDSVLSKTLQKINFQTVLNKILILLGKSGIY
jgi:Zn-dependent M16 (insulinase) family peptidase